jgi:hypothetical protein
MRHRTPWLLLLALCASLPLSSCVSRKVSEIAAPGELRIVSLTAEPDSIYLNQQSRIVADVENPDGGALTYSWTAYQGAVAGIGPEVVYVGSYCCAGTDWVILTVRNEERDEAVTQVIVMTVFPYEQ